MLLLSQTNLESFSAWVMNSGLMNDFVAVSNLHGPLIPHTWSWMISPDLDAHLLASVYLEWRLDRKVHGEPRMHAFGVCSWVGWVVDVLVELSCEVAGKPMNFTLHMFHCKLLEGMALERRVGVLLQGGEFLVVWVGQVSKGEYLLGLVAAREDSVVDLNHVWQLERMVLLAHWNSSANALLSVQNNFIPDDLAAQRNNLVCVAPW